MAHSVYLVILSLMAVTIGEHNLIAHEVNNSSYTHVSKELENAYWVDQSRGGLTEQPNEAIADGNIEIFTYSFENGENATWTDESKGGVKWGIDEGAVQAGKPPGPPDGSARYLRLYPSTNGVFYPAIFFSSYYEITGEQFKSFNISFDYWINSGYPEHNNIEIYLHYDGKYLQLTDTTFYKDSKPNSSWRNYNRVVDLNINIFDRFAVVIFGFCGLSNQDGIALDNIRLSGFALFTSTSQSSSDSTTETSEVPMTNSTEAGTTTGTESSTDVIFTDTTRVGSTTFEPDNTTTTENYNQTTNSSLLTGLIARWFLRPVGLITQQSDELIAMNDSVEETSSSFCSSSATLECWKDNESFQIDLCTPRYCLCDDVGAHEEVCQITGHIFDSKDGVCKPCGQVKDCKKLCF